MVRANLSSRRVYLDLLRVIAIILVIYNHSAAFAIPRSEVYTLSGFMIYFMSSMCKVAVPLFFMISGALLLNREEDYIELYKKRVGRFVVIIVFFFLIQSIWRNVGGSVANVKWFLSAYLMLLIFLPLIRILARHMQNRDYLYLLLICCVVEMMIHVPYYFMYEMYPGIVANSLFRPLGPDVPFTAGYGVFFMLMGRYSDIFLAKKMEKKLFRSSIAIGAFICLIISTFVLYNVRNQELMGGFIAIPTISAYLWVKYLSEKVNITGHVGVLISLMGGSVLTIMLTENICRDLVATYIIPLVRIPDAGYLVHLIHVMLSFVCACVLGMLLKQVPVVKKYL